MWYLKTLLEFLKYCMFKKKKRFLFKDWTYWNFIQRQDLLKFYYSKLLVLKRALRGLLVKAPLLAIKADIVA